MQTFLPRTSAPSLFRSSAPVTRGLLTSSRPLVIAHEPRAPFRDTDGSQSRALPAVAASVVPLLKRRFATMGSHEKGAKAESSAEQQRFMEQDMCILVDDSDSIVGSASKKATHWVENAGELPKLHRAFSVFLFDKDKKLLLQKRAASKITFPQAWTNTCCSHPLHGMTPDEVDLSVEDGTVVGVKRAAVRKLEHELGIKVGDIALDKFHFVTRLHYAAIDPTEPQPGKWGEHEVDYILVCHLDEIPPMQLDPDEVEEVKWVQQDELPGLMKVGRWSPWFSLLVESGLLNQWWTADGLKHDTKIHRMFKD